MNSKLLNAFLSIGIVSMVAFPLSSSAKGGKTVPKYRTIVLTGEAAYLATQGAYSVAVFVECKK